MKRKELFRLLTDSCIADPGKSKPAFFNDIHEYDLVDNGHVIEYYEVGPGKKKVLAMLFECGDMIFRSHPSSSFENVDGASIVHINRDKAAKIARRFPIAGPLFTDYFYNARKNYLMRLEERIRVFNEYDPFGRYMHLLNNHPWVFEQLSPADIASYLAVPVEFVVEQLI
jgi:hypothetical protein